MFDIIKHYPKVSEELVAKYRQLDESASISECMKVNHALRNNIRPVWPGSRCCGTALTICSRPGDNLMLHKAISIAKPGDVIVMDCGEYDECGGMFGGIMSNACKVQGVQGLITNGCVRDTMMMKSIEFPVWARGISVRGSTKNERGTINHPIIIGGVLVNPGDLVFADNDAVVVVPREEAEEVYARALAREKHEDDTLLKVLKDGTATFQNFRKNFEALEITEEED